MIKNYFKIDWRNITGNPFYSFINIIGLSTGIAFTMLISAYLWNELQVNKNLKNAYRQYIIQSKWKNPNEGDDFTALGQLPKALKESFPDLVTNYYRWDGITSNISKGDKAFREDIAICDSTMFNMYGFTLLYGNAATVLSEPYSVVITKDRAIKYFGKTDIVGQTVEIENFPGSKHDFVITGVLNNYTTNSVTDLTDGYSNHFFVSTSNLNFFGRNMKWSDTHIRGYIELQKGITPAELEKPITQLLKLNAPPYFVRDPIM